MDVLVLSSPAPEFLGPARRLVRGLRAGGRRVTLRITGRGGRYALFSKLSHSSVALLVYIGHGHREGWTAWGTTGAGYLNALSWSGSIGLLINLTCEGEWARTLVPSGIFISTVTTTERLSISSLDGLIGSILGEPGRAEAWSGFRVD